MSTRRIVTSFVAGAALVAGLVLPASASQAAAGYCSTFKTSSWTDKTVTVQNPCGNLQGRYYVEFRQNGTTKTWRFTLTPLASRTITPGGSGGWTISIY
jgi:hypothetical protein